MPLVSWGIDLSIGVVGAVGGAIRYAVNRRRPWWEAVIATTTGAVMAVWLAPASTPVVYSLLVKWTDAEVDPTVLMSALAFLIGVSGRDLLERLIDFIRFYRRK